MPKSIKVGFSVDPRVDLYLVRPQDQAIMDEIKAWRPFNLYGGRQMGKSSSIRYLRMQLDKDIEVVHLDITKVEGHIAFDNQKAASFSEWLAHFDEVLWDLADLDGATPNHNDQGTLSCLQTTFRSAAKQIGKRCIFVLDEYDVLSVKPWFSDFLVAYRAMSQEPDQHYLVCLSGFQPPELYQRGMAKGQAFYGRSIQVTGFADDEKTCKAISDGIERPLPWDTWLRICHFTGGHGIFSMTLLRDIIRLDKLTTSGVDQAAQRILDSDNSLLEAFGILLTEFNQEDNKVFYVLNDCAHGIARDVPDSTWALLNLSGIFIKRADGVSLSGELFVRYFQKEMANLLDEAAKRRIAKTQSGVEGKQILVLNTGGTVGMMTDTDGNVREATNKEFLEMFRLGSGVVFQNFGRVLDSINVGLREWIDISRFIDNALKESDYDAVVVLHGTDTMCYTAAAIAYSFGDTLDIPIVFTGAQTPADFDHGDAMVNLHRAIEVAKKGNPEVMLVFGDKVFRAVRSQKLDDRGFNGFESPNFHEIGRIGAQVEMVWTREREDSSQRQPIRASFCDSVFQISLYPGLDPQYLQAVIRGTKPPHALIINTLGAGNVPSRDEYSLIPVIEEAISLDIPVVLTSQHPPLLADTERYEPAQAAIAAGAVFAGNMTLPAASVKLRWLLGKYENEGYSEMTSVEYVRTWMKHDFVGELQLKARYQ